MIAGEIAMYFRGIDYNNRLLDRYGTLLASSPYADQSDLQKAHAAHITVDMSIEAAIEARLRDGLLTAADRDRFIAVAPQHLRDRFLRIQPSKAACLQEPWWAFWR